MVPVCWLRENIWHLNKVVRALLDRHFQSSLYTLKLNTLYRLKEYLENSLLLFDTWSTRPFWTVQMTWYSRLGCNEVQMTSWIILLSGWTNQELEKEVALGNEVRELGIVFKDPWMWCVSSKALTCSHLDCTCLNIDRTITIQTNNVRRECFPQWRQYWKVLVTGTKCDSFERKWDQKVKFRRDYGRRPGSLLNYFIGERFVEIFTTRQYE